MALEAAHELDLPLMVHIGDILTESPRAPELTRHLLPSLRPGDVITHVCTSRSGGLLDANRKVLTQAREVQLAGIVMDPAFGRSNWNYEVCVAQADQGFHPDTISTDMSTPGRATAIFSLTEAMVRFMACGYSLADVVRMTTVNPARALGLQDSIGAIKPGYDADLTILDHVTGNWRFVDSFGNAFGGAHSLVPVHTIRAGALISPDWGPRPWGWLPDSQ
jgi:dihydroorotase